MAKCRRQNEDLPDITKDIPEGSNFSAIKQLIIGMTAFDPKQRIPMSDVVATLKDIGGNTTIIF